MNRTIKDATVRRYHYASHDQLRAHLADFVNAYNVAKRLKTLRGLTVFEFISKKWLDQPSRFHHHPDRLTAGLNTLHHGQSGGGRHAFRLHGHDYVCRRTAAGVRLPVASARAVPHHAVGFLRAPLAGLFTGGVSGAGDLVTVMLFLPARLAGLLMARRMRGRFDRRYGNLLRGLAGVAAGVLVDKGLARAVLARRTLRGPCSAPGRRSPTSALEGKEGAQG